MHRDTPLRPPEARDVTQQLERLPALLEATPRLLAQGRFLDTECLIGTHEVPFHLTLREGRIVRMEEGARLMRSWRFSYCATPEALREYWQAMPRPGWHDLLALTKRGAATLQGDLHPFVANLQYFKDLLALPRAEARP